MRAPIFIRYLPVPLFYLVVALVGSAFTSPDSAWYRTLNKPSFTPPGSVIGVVWTVIYVLTATSLVVFLKRAEGSGGGHILALYVINGILNALWSYIFFSKQMIGPAVVCSAVIATTVLLLIVVTWNRARPAALLLLPYLGWVSFATFLNWSIYRIN